MNLIITISFFLIALASLAPGTEAIQEKGLVLFLQKVLDHISPLAIPDFSFSELNLYANATNIELSNFVLTDLQLSIPDEQHMQFDLSGLSGDINLDLNAGITGPIPIHRKDKVKGDFENMNVEIVFEVGDGDAIMSNVTISIGKMTLNFGTDTLANLLAKLFMPVFKTTVEDVLPGIVLLMKHELDFQHLMALLVKAIPEVPLPKSTFSFQNYNVILDSVQIEKVTVPEQIFSIQKKNQLVFASNGLYGTGQLTLLIGKPGQENRSKVAINLHNTKIQVVVEVIGQKKKGNLELRYVSSKQVIGQFSLVCDSTDPIMVWLVSAMEPLVKSLLEEGFNFLIRFLLGL